MNALRDVQMIASGRQPVGDGAVAVAQMVLDLVDRLGRRRRGDMSPKPLDEFVDETPQPPPSAPVRRGAPPRAEGVQEVSLPEETLRPDMPVIRARVVYLGPGEHHAVSFTGQIHEEWIEDPDGPVTRKDRQKVERRYTVIKSAVPTGTSQYDFTCRDTRGHLIAMRMMPDSANPSRLRGRPFTWCEHVGHLRQFFLARDEGGQPIYHLMVLPKDVAMLQDHIRRSERARRAQSQLFADVVKG